MDRLISASSARPRAGSRRSKRVCACRAELTAVIPINGCSALAQSIAAAHAGKTLTDCAVRASFVIGILGYHFSLESRGVFQPSCIVLRPTGIRITFVVERTPAVLLSQLHSCVNLRRRAAAKRQVVQTCPTPIMCQTREIRRCREGQIGAACSSKPSRRRSQPHSFIASSRSPTHSSM